MNKVKINFDDEVMGTKGELTFKRLSIADAREMEKNVGTKSTEAKMLTMKLNKLEEFARSASSLSEYEKIESQMQEIAQNLRDVNALMFNESVKACVTHFESGMIDGVEVKATELESKLSFAALQQIQTALMGGLVVKS